MTAPKPPDPNDDPFAELDVVPRHAAMEDPEFRDLQERIGRDPENPPTQASQKLIRQRTALGLYMAGYNYAEIGRELGLEQSTIRRYIRDLIQESSIEIADEIRDVELARMARLDRTFWPMALKGDHKAARIVLETMQRRAKMLGLDAPKKIEFRDVAMEELAKMARAAGIPLEEVQPEMIRILEGSAERIA